MYYSIEDGDHFVSCLRLVDTHMRKKHKDETDVRWIIIGLYDALYAVLIEKLTRTDGFGIFNQRFEERIGQFYREGKDSRDPEFLELCEASNVERVASVEALLKRAKLKSNAKIVRSGVDEASPPTLGLSRLKAMRDDHSHPRPMSHSIEADYLVSSFEDTLSVIQEISAISGHRHCRHDEGEIEILLASILFYLGRWKNELEAQEWGDAFPTTLP